MKYILFSVLLAGGLSVPVASAEPSKEQVLAQLRDHYAFATDLKRFRIRYDLSYDNPWQAYDYRNPRAATSFRHVEFDTEKRHYYLHDRIYWPGNFNFDLVRFQNDDEGMLYDANGMLFGKQLQRAPLTRYDTYWERVAPTTSFLAAQPLLQEVAGDIQFEMKDDQAVFTQKDEDGSKTIYKFALAPVQLRSKYVEKDDQEFVFERFRDVDGIIYAAQIKLLTNGQQEADFHISVVEKIDGIAPEKLMPPAGYGPIVEDGDKTQVMTEIADNLYLVTNSSQGRNMLVRPHAGGVMVFGAPLRDELSEEVIALIEKNFPGRTITHVFVSHAHSDHISGLGAYAKRGVKIVADAYTAEAIRAFPKFKDDSATFQFEVIETGDVMAGARFYVLENSHVKGQSFVYFGDEKIIYEGDFLEIPQDNTIPTHMADVERTFIEFIRKEGLAFDRIVGHHRNNNIRPAVVKAFYETNMH